MLEHTELDINQLLAIVNEDQTSQVVCELLQAANANDNMELLKDEALALFWQRRVSTFASLSDRELDGLLAISLGWSARSTIGDAARLDMLTLNQVDRALKTVSQSEWGFNQLMARRHLFELRDLSRNSVAFRSNIIENLMQLACGWAIQECCGYLTLLEAETLKIELLSSKLSRYDKHKIKEAIRRSESVQKRERSNESGLFD